MEVKNFEKTFESVLPITRNGLIIVNRKLVTMV